MAQALGGLEKDLGDFGLGSGVATHFGDCCGQTAKLDSEGAGFQEFGSPVVGKTMEFGFKLGERGFGLRRSACWFTP